MTSFELPADREPACPSDLALDRWLLGELDAEGARSIEAHLAGCAACAQRGDELRAARSLDDMELARAMRRARVAPRRRNPLVWAAPCLAVAAALLLYVRLPGRPKGVLTKGGVGLSVFVQGKDGRGEPLASGIAVPVGAALRFALSSDVNGAGLVVGLDAAKHVSIYAQGMIAAGPEQLLPGAVALDDTPGAERLVGLVCNQAPSEERVREEATRALERSGGDPRAVARLELECRQTALTLEKHR